MSWKRVDSELELELNFWNLNRIWIGMGIVATFLWPFCREGGGLPEAGAIALHLGLTHLQPHPHLLRQNHRPRGIAAPPAFARPRGEMQLWESCWWPSGVLDGLLEYQLVIWSPSRGQSDLLISWSPFWSLRDPAGPLVSKLIFWNPSWHLDYLLGHSW